MHRRLVRLNDQHGLRRVADDPCGHAADNEMRQTFAAVRRQYEKVRLYLARVCQNTLCRFAAARFDLVLRAAPFQMGGSQRLQPSARRFLPYGVRIERNRRELRGIQGQRSDALKTASF